MTKIFLSLLLCWGAVFSLRAQDQALGLDENGKLIYFELVNVKASKDSLKIRLIHFFKQQKELKYKINPTDSVFVATGKLVIHKTLLVLTHPSGEISYRLQAELKDDKYRFWFSDFNFIPYQKDRYGNFVPSTRRGLPLEKIPSKQEQAQWNEYQSLLYQHLQRLAIKIKGHLQNVAPQMIKPIIKTVTKTW